MGGWAGSEDAAIDPPLGYVEGKGFCGSALVGRCGGHKIGRDSGLAEGEDDGLSLESRGATHILRLALDCSSAVVDIDAPVQGPNAVREGRGVNNAGHQKRVAGREVVQTQLDAVADGACGSAVVALPQFPVDYWVQPIRQSRILRRENDLHQLARSVSFVAWEQQVHFEDARLGLRIAHGSHRAAQQHSPGERTVVVEGTHAGEMHGVNVKGLRAKRVERPPAMLGWLPEESRRGKKSE